MMAQNDLPTIDMRRKGNCGMRTPCNRFLLTLGCFLWTWAAGQAAEPPPLKVLFIGNSYTYVNDLPALVVALADAAGGRRIEVDRSLEGGYTFQQHVQEGNAIEKIREKRWDLVVLQEQSLQPLIGRDSMEKYARLLNAEIKRQGAKTVFYLTWARQNIPQMQAGADPATSPEYANAVYQIDEETGAASVGRAHATLPRWQPRLRRCLAARYCSTSRRVSCRGGRMSDHDFVYSQTDPCANFENWWTQRVRGLVGGLNGAYFDLADELGAIVAPVGLAWQKALQAQPPPVLHDTDKSHPTPQGSYLAACVFFATLLDKSPVGLPAELKKGKSVLLRLAPDEAKRLQTIAWQTVQAAKRR
jgi:hypothetical protein